MLGSNAVTAPKIKLALNIRVRLKTEVTVIAKIRLVINTEARLKKKLVSKKNYEF